MHYCRTTQWWTPIVSPRLELISSRIHGDHLTIESTSNGKIVNLLVTYLKILLKFEETVVTGGTQVCQIWNNWHKWHWMLLYVIFQTYWIWSINSEYRHGDSSSSTIFMSSGVSEPDSRWSHGYRLLRNPIRELSSCSVISCF